MTPTLTPIPQDAFVDAIHALAASLKSDSWTPDFLVGIGRGGLVPATYLSHATGKPLLSVDHSSEQPDFAADLLEKLAARTAAGTKLLLVDDINDSGRTLGFIRAALKAAGGNMANVRVATLIDNIVSAERVDYAARTIDRTTLKDWFVFPWEAVAPTETVIEDSAAVPERIA